MADLLPCPFCGGENAKIWSSQDEEQAGCGTSYAEQFQVLCPAFDDDDNPTGCGATTGWEMSEAEAIAAWNTRSPAVLGVDLVVPPNADETK